MNIGIIVYSETGNTLALCEQARDILTGYGQTVTLARITVNDVKLDRSLRDAPVADRYDLVILGTPVQGFSLPVPVKEYLARATFAQGVKLGVLITQYFKADWLGGTQTLKQALAAFARFNPVFYGSGIVHVRSRKRDEQINAAMRALTNFEGKF